MWGGNESVDEVDWSNSLPTSLSNNEACRSLRSCLRHHAKKENGRFVRKELDGAILYAVRKVSACTHWLGIFHNLCFHSPTLQPYIITTNVINIFGEICPVFRSNYYIPSLHRSALFS